MSGRHQLSKSSWYKSLQEIPYEDEAVSSKVRCSICSIMQQLRPSQWCKTRPSATEQAISSAPSCLSLTI
eukprot:scaffold198562_cov47-Attheya_sp.AAC.5